MFGHRRNFEGRLLRYRRGFELVVVVVDSGAGDAAVVRQVGISSACEDMCSRHSHVTVIYSMRGKKHPLPRRLIFREIK